MTTTLIIIVALVVAPFLIAIVKAALESGAALYLFGAAALVAGFYFVVLPFFRSLL